MSCRVPVGCFVSSLDPCRVWVRALPGDKLGGRVCNSLSLCFLPPSKPQSSKDSLKTEILNVSTSFEDLDEQVKSDIGYSSEDMNIEPGTEALGASRSRPYLSTQMVYELRTKLRCTREESS